MEIVKVENLRKIYRQDDLEIQALSGINLSLESGEFTVVAGPSGSGKSTLLHLIGGLDRPTEGRILLGGEDITRLGKGRLSQLRLSKIGFIFQSYNLIPVLTAYENAEFILLLQGMPYQKRRQHVMELLEEVGLKGLESRRPYEMSGGQQQRVAVARALASNPDLVLADEPTANLDSKTGLALIDMMLDMNKTRGVTFLISTHDTRVMDKARRVILLKDGQISSDVRVGESLAQNNTSP
ncbi:MAG: ABC transporter ATP-binding protein [Thermodesulfobacteriota bacterium]|nr:ABC transporter ATP-binding protein [Thermodesulfobacteriota bacterium]